MRKDDDPWVGAASIPKFPSKIELAHRHWRAIACHYAVQKLDMTSTIGFSGGGGPHLPVARTSAAIFFAGPFAARLAPTMVQKIAGQLPEALWTGLLSTPPDADGEGHVEVEGPGYERQRLTVTSYNGDFDANVEPISFYLEHGAAARHVGLFDDKGHLRFYGFLSGHQKCATPPRVLEFPAFALMLKRMKVAPTEGLRPQLGGARRP